MYDYTKERNEELMYTVLYCVIRNSNICVMQNVRQEKTKEKGKMGKNGGYLSVLSRFLARNGKMLIML